MRSNFDGSQIETLVETGRGEVARKDLRNWCVGIAVDTDRKQIYWTQKGSDNAGQGRIFRANVDLPKGESPSSVPTSSSSSTACPSRSTLELDLASRMLYWTDRGDPPRGNSVSRAPLDAARASAQSRRSSSLT